MIYFFFSIKSININKYIFLIYKFYKIYKKNK